MAVPAISGKAVSLMATTSAGENSYSVSGVTFERGKFYAIKVRMSNVIHVKNQSELTAAVETSGHVLPLLRAPKPDIQSVGHKNGCFRAQTHLDLTSALGK